ncbi:MAG: hypothetical protein ACPIOQ_58140, partial [Promethearchaeia archaeon]
MVASAASAACPRLKTVREDTVLLGTRPAMPQVRPAQRAFPFTASSVRGPRRVQLGYRCLTSALLFSAVVAHISSLLFTRPQERVFVREVQIQYEPTDLATFLCFVFAGDDRVS